MPGFYRQVGIIDDGEYGHQVDGDVTDGTGGVQQTQRFAVRESTVTLTSRMWESYARDRVYLRKKTALYYSRFHNHEEEQDGGDRLI